MWAGAGCPGSLSRAVAICLGQALPVISLREVDLSLLLFTAAVFAAGVLAGAVATCCSGGACCALLHLRRAWLAKDEPPAPEPTNVSSGGAHLRRLRRGGGTLA